MKTPEEIKKKYEELNQSMRDHIPNENDIKKLRDDMLALKDTTLSDDVRTAILLKIYSKPIETVSIDAQRYLLEWIMEQHD